MAHMVETMAYAGELPWHGLGKKVNSDLSPKEMLVEAGLDWGVEKKSLIYTTDVNGKFHTGSVPHKEALVRTSDGKLLDVVGSDWKPLQNEKAFEFFHDFVSAGDMEMHTAGSLDDGKRVWALAKVKDSFEVFKNDQVDQYLLLSNPHMYGYAIDVRMTPIRVVCNNTLTFALHGKSDRMVQVSHKRDFNPELVKAMLGVAHEKMTKYAEAAKFLASKRAKKFDVQKYFDSLYPSMSKKEVKDGEELRSKVSLRLEEILNTQPGAEHGAGTWWQPFNAVTYLNDHEIGRDTNGRMKSAWFGLNRAKKVNALEKAIEFAEAA